MMRAALAYAERLGIAVHPVSRAKAPLSPHGFKDATTDERQIREWWTRHPDANIGARCEAFFVLDVDPRDGGHRVVEQWRSVHGDFPYTWEAATGSGGMHYYFRHNPALDALPLGRLVAGVDLKGGGRGYVLLPPSVNKSGPYRWRVRPSACELASAPQWLIRAIERIKARPVVHAEPADLSRCAGIDRVERARRYAARMSPAISGANGSGTTIRACCLVARGFGLTRDEAYAVLAGWNATCKPPWSHEDLMRKIDETLEKGAAPMGFLLDRRSAA